MKKILMFPGAFNPPHYGHARAIEAALANITENHFDYKNFLPPSIADYIEKHNLYSE